MELYYCMRACHVGAQTTLDSSYSVQHRYSQCVGVQIDVNWTFWPGGALESLYLYTLSETMCVCGEAEGYRVDVWMGRGFAQEV